MGCLLSGDILRDNSEWSRSTICLQLQLASVLIHDTIQHTTNNLLRRRGGGGSNRCSSSLICVACTVESHCLRHAARSLPATLATAREWTIRRAGWFTRIYELNYWYLLHCKLFMNTASPGGEAEHNHQLRMYVRAYHWSLQGPGDHEHVTSGRSWKSDSGAERSKSVTHAATHRASWFHTRLTTSISSPD